MPVSFPIVGLSSGDLNGDGAKDVVAGFTESPGEADAGGIAVFLRNGSGGFATPSRYNSLDRASSGVTVGDFNADGRSDVVVGPRDFINITNLSVFFQGATGQLLSPVALRSAVTPDAMLAADMNADGRDDLLVAHISTWALGYLQQGPSGLSAEIKYGIPPLDYRQTSSVAVGDVNHDGYKDAITVRAGSALVVLHGTGKRDGIRVNGGQPLPHAGASAIASQVHQSDSRASLGTAVLQPRPGPVPIASRLNRGSSQWTRPFRQNTLFMGLGYLGATLVENYQEGISRLQGLFAIGEPLARPTLSASMPKRPAAVSAEAPNGPKHGTAKFNYRTLYRKVCMSPP
jgi:hypothetical protein